MRTLIWAACLLAMCPSIGYSMGKGPARVAANAQGMQTDGQHVYWYDSEARSVLRTNPAGSPIEKVAQTDQDVIRLSDGFILLGSLGQRTFTRISKDLQQVVTIPFALPARAFMPDFATDADTVFIASCDPPATGQTLRHGQIFAIEVATGASRVIFDSTAQEKRCPIDNLVSVGDSLAFNEYLSQKTLRVVAVPKKGGPARVLTEQSLRIVSHVEDTLLLVADPAPAGSTLFGLSVASAPSRAPQELVRSPNQIYAAALGAGVLYWLEQQCRDFASNCAEWGGDAYWYATLKARALSGGPERTLVEPVLKQGDFPGDADPLALALAGNALFTTGVPKGLGRTPLP
jgi:hypothetical protein